MLHERSGEARAWITKVSKLRAFFVVALMSAVFESCVGVDATVTIEGGGNGKVELRYTVSKMTASLGELEANERLIPLPVSREDFDRSVRGIEGLSLVSYAQKDEAENLVVDVELSFASLKALVGFLDPKGERASYSEEGARKRLSLVLAAGVPALDPDLEKLIDAAFAPYSVAIAFKLPSPALSSGIGTASANGTQLKFERPVAELAKSKTELSWDIVW